METIFDKIKIRDVVQFTFGDQLCTGMITEYQKREENYRFPIKVTIEFHVTGDVIK